jgi:hypothetical protein
MKVPASSCWLIVFSDDVSPREIILSEEYYRMEVERGFAGRPILCEAHWYDIYECRARNRGIPYYR